jgi:hypothetical protein
MTTFHDPQIVKLSDEIVDRARKFSAAVIGTVNYGDSHQHDAEKIRDDHFVSKLGEESARLIFESRGAKVEGPDYRVYRGKEKSWDFDLKVNGIPLAVKTQRRTAAQMWGLSWAFQCAPERRDTILDDPEAWVCFVEYDDTGADVICIVYPIKKMKQLVFGEPRLKKLIGVKKMVYAADQPNWGK